MDLKYPISEETIHKYAKDIFTPIMRGECVATIWVPMTGRRRHNDFVINNIQLFKKELPDFERYLLVYVDPLDLTEESKSGYIRLIGKNFIDACRMNKASSGIEILNRALDEFNDETAGYSKLIDVLKELFTKVTSKGFSIVLFLGEFDELEYLSTVFFGNLKSLWNKLYPKLHFVFLLRGRATRPENIKLWGEELSEIVLQNIVYVPLLGERDMEYMFERLSQEFKVKFNPEEIQVIKRLCGGHPYMLKVAARALAVSARESKKSKIEKFLLDHHELLSIATRIYRRQTDKDRLALRDISQGKKVRDISKDGPIEFLEKMGIIIMDSRGKYRLFSDVFKEAVLQYERESGDKPENELRLDSFSNRVLLGNKPAEDKFSQQELSILKMFLLTEGTFSSREQIGKTLWGEKIDKKFSDWAIDQLMSKLRKKIRDLGINAEVVTLRGEGYRFYKSSN